MTENAGCAACLGGPVDTFGRMNSPMKCIQRDESGNFPRSDGSQGIAGVPGVAGMTVAASAITGKITDPRGYWS